jgi:hypothetical protein
VGVSLGLVPDRLGRAAPRHRTEERPHNENKLSHHRRKTAAGAVLFQWRWHLPILEA